jgi:hypothetical protein
VEDAGMQKLPLGKGSAEKVVVSYSAEAGGYSPGDTWTLFVGPDKNSVHQHGHVQRSEPRLAAREEGAEDDPRDVGRMIFPRTFSLLALSPSAA